MIVRITFLDKDQKEETRLFGDSYKKWSLQYQEFVCLMIKWVDTRILGERQIFGISKVEVSKSEWKSFGGLKWCCHTTFQNELNREGVQAGEPDNPNPRQYSDMVFAKNQKIETSVRDYYTHRLRHLA